MAEQKYLANVIDSVMTISSINQFNHHMMSRLSRREIRGEDLVKLGILRHTLVLTKMLLRKKTVLCQSLNSVTAEYELLKVIKVSLI